MGDKIGLKGKGLTNTRPSLVTLGVDSCWEHISQLEEYGLRDLKGPTVILFPRHCESLSRPLRSDNGSSGETVTFTLTRMQGHEKEEEAMCGSTTDYATLALGRLLCPCTRMDPGHVITKAVFHCRHNPTLNLPTKPRFCAGGVNRSMGNRGYRRLR